VLENACDSGYLTRGDYLVLDNASIHDAIDSFDLVQELLQMHGMNVSELFQPYSDFL
jgi:hypothetical protein